MVHTPDDGRGARLVYVNGRLVNNVLYADDVKGVVRCYRDPIKLHKYGKRLVLRTLRGSVRVTLKQCVPCVRSNKSP